MKTAQKSGKQLAAEGLVGVVAASLCGWYFFFYLPSEWKEVEIQAASWGTVKQCYNTRVEIRGIVGYLCDVVGNDGVEKNLLCQMDHCVEIKDITLGMR